MTTTTLLPRSAWTETGPASSGRLVRPVGLAVHWVGLAVPPAVERAEKAAVARYLEAIRRTHRAKGWSDIAYQEAVDQAGRRWRLRGWELRSAANGDTVPNARFGAVVALIGQGQRPSHAMLRGLAESRAAFRRAHPTGDRLVTHSDIRPEPTACPGPVLSSWVHDAHGRPPADPSTPRPSAVVTEEDRMVVIVHPNGSRYHLTSKGLVWLDAEEAASISGAEPTVVKVDRKTWDAYSKAFPTLKP